MISVPLPRLPARTAREGSGVCRPGIPCGTRRVPGAAAPSGPRTPPARSPAIVPGEQYVGRGGGRLGSPKTTFTVAASPSRAVTPVSSFGTATGSGPPTVSGSRSRPRCSGSGGSSSSRGKSNRPRPAARASRPEVTNASSPPGRRTSADTAPADTAPACPAPGRATARCSRRRTVMTLPRSRPSPRARRTGRRGGSGPGARAGCCPGRRCGTDRGAGAASPCR